MPNNQLKDERQFMKTFFCQTLLNFELLNKKISRIEVAIKEAHAKDAKEEMLEEAKSMIKVSKHDHIVNFQGVCVENDTV